MPEERCDLSDLPVDQCACRIHRPEDPEPKDKILPFPARFEGECRTCDGSIRKGDVIVKTEDGYAHLECV